MEIQRYSKAIAAFVVALFVPFLGTTLTGFDVYQIAISTACGFASAVATALTVFWVPNKSHGYNVNDIADVLIKAGLEAVSDHEGGPDGQHTSRNSPDQGQGRQTDQAGRYN